MSSGSVLPELKQILGALVFGADRPLTERDMRTCLREVAEKLGGETAAFGSVKPKEITEALEALEQETARNKSGFVLREVAGGYRFQSDPACVKWRKHLLNMEKPQRLTKPALETLAIIAYRQPISKPDIEAIRGVGVDHMIKTLMELQLVKIAGRSELPGRPFLYGTTHTFLEHFGLKSLKELDDIEPLLRQSADGARKEAAQAAAAGGAAAPAPEPVLEPVPEPVLEPVLEPAPEPEAETDATADASDMSDTSDMSDMSDTTDTTDKE